MKQIKYFILTLLFVCFFSFFSFPIFSEDKPVSGVIPKLPKTADDPELFNNFVYPNWGPVCQKYQYLVTYRDRLGRPPKYMRIIFNGQPIEMEPAFAKASAGKEDYKKGVQYVYKFVPNKIDSNFYYFEASNGKGKARAAIIDSPDNGPVLFESSFKNNEIGLIDLKTGKKIFSFPTEAEWIGGVVLSDDGQYLASKTSKHIYFFETKKLDKPVWQYECQQCQIGGDMSGGIDISSDGSKIIAGIGNLILLFDKSSNRPLWQYQAIPLAVAISKDGHYLAAGVAASSNQGKQTNILLFWSENSEKPLWQYETDSNFHDVSLSADGSFIAASTGCPDRKAYIFSKDSNIPLVKSDRLTYDSPISRSKISSDGRITAFSTEGGPNSSVVVLFSKDSAIPLWKFDNQKKNSSRSLGITSDGKYLAVATMAGDVYFLETKNNLPLKSWAVNSSIGALDISDDGTTIAAGGTDNKVYLLDAKTGEKKVVNFNEFIETVDISGNGQYAAAGTGGGVYFFESYITASRGKTFPCTTVIEPPPRDQVMKNFEAKDDARLPEKDLLGKIRRFFNQTYYFIISRFSKNQNYQPGINAPPTKNKESISAVCGNNLCESDFGETRENCLKDCSGGD